MIYKYSKEKATLYYSLNFAVYALGKACEIVGISREMVYRAVDIQGKCEVNWHDFSSFLKEVLSTYFFKQRNVIHVYKPNYECARS